MIDIVTMENLVKDYPDDEEAWKKISDMLCDEKNFGFDRFNTGEDEEEYLRCYYPKVRIFAEITYVMATVPVYVLVEAMQNDTWELVSLVHTSSEKNDPIVPVFFSRESAENSKNYLKGSICNIRPMKTLLCMLVDCAYGMKSKEADLRFTFVDERPQHKWATLRKTQIFDIVFDSGKAIFGGYESYFLPEDWGEMPDEEYMNSGMKEEKNLFPVWDRFHKKPPVS